MKKICLLLCTVLLLLTFTSCELIESIVNEEPPENAFRFEEYDLRTIKYNGKTYKDVRTLGFDIADDEWVYIGEGEYYDHFSTEYDSVYVYPNKESPIAIRHNEMGTYVCEDFYTYADEYNGNFKFSGMRVTKTYTVEETEEIRTFSFEKPLGLPEILTGNARYEYERTIGDYIEFSVELISAEDNKIVREIDLCFMIDDSFYVCAYKLWDYQFTGYYDMGFQVNSELLKGE